MRFISSIASATATSPSSALGRVGDHKVRRDATEHALNVGRHCAVAAEETMPPEEPQIARLRHRVLGHRRRVVGIGQTRGLVREQRAELDVMSPRSASKG